MSRKNVHSERLPAYDMRMPDNAPHEAFVSAVTMATGQPRRVIEDHLSRRDKDKSFQPLTVQKETPRIEQENRSGGFSPVTGPRLSWAYLIPHYLPVEIYLMFHLFMSPRVRFVPILNTADSVLKALNHWFLISRFPQVFSPIERPSILTTETSLWIYHNVSITGADDASIASQQLQLKHRTKKNFLSRVCPSLPYIKARTVIDHQFSEIPITYLRRLKTQFSGFIVFRPEFLYGLRCRYDDGFEYATFGDIIHYRFNLESSEGVWHKGYSVQYYRDLLSLPGIDLQGSNLPFISYECNPKSVSCPHSFKTKFVRVISPKFMKHPDILIPSELYRIVWDEVFRGTHCPSFADIYNIVSFFGSAYVLQKRISFEELKILAIGFTVHATKVYSHMYRLVGWQRKHWLSRIWYGLKSDAYDQLLEWILPERVEDAMTLEFGSKPLLPVLTHGEVSFRSWDPPDPEKMPFTIEQIRDHLRLECFRMPAPTIFSPVQITNSYTPMANRIVPTRKIIDPIKVIRDLLERRFGKENLNSQRDYRKVEVQGWKVVSSMPKVTLLPRTKPLDRRGYLPTVRTGVPFAAPTGSQDEALKALIKRTNTASNNTVAYTPDYLADMVLDPALKLLFNDDAPRLIKLYMADESVGSTESWVEWFANLSMHKKLAIMRTKFSRSAAGMVGWLMLLIKNKAKPDIMEGVAKKNPAPQVIAYHRPGVGPLKEFSHFVNKVAWPRWLSLLDPRYVMMFHKSTADLRESIRKGLTPHVKTGRRLYVVENDFSDYDKGQGVVAALLEMRIWVILGARLDYTTQWFEGQFSVHISGRSYGINLTLAMQRRTGTATTSFGNTLLNVIIYVSTFGKPVFAIFLGDDVSGWFEVPLDPKVDYASKINAETNATSRVIHDVPSEFCSQLIFSLPLKDVTTVAQPWKVAMKLGLPLKYDPSKTRNELLAENFIALRDTLVGYERADVVEAAAAAHAIREEHLTSGQKLRSDLFPETKMLMRALHTISCDEGLYRQFWETDVSIF